MMLSRMWSPLSVVLLSACVLLAPATAAFGQWNERTEMKFSAPVMVPGATLQPGTYVFQLVNPSTAGDVLEIRKDDGTLITTTMTVPTKRAEAKGDNVLKFNPTEEGSPPALAAWFYPGSIYGHQFVYPDEQAKKIAQRTKTVVLSTDVAGSDMEKATLRVYDASGMARDWQPDPDAMESWEQWSRNRRATASVVTEKAAGERARATAPAVDAKFQGTRVKIDQLEDNPTMYTGKTVSVDAEVEEVFGPRLFTIDEPNWGDLDGEILVFVPTPLAAMVRDDDRITVTGTVKPFVTADFEKEWGWLDLDESLEVELKDRPVLVASRIIGGNNKTAMIVNVNEPAPAAVGTSGGATGTMGTVSNISSLENADERMVGRSVDLDGIAVHAKGQDRGFFVKAGNHLVFVLPASDATVSQGQTLSLEGVVLEMPRHMRNQLNAPASGDLNKDVYIYAMKVNR